MSGRGPAFALCLSLAGLAAGCAEESQPPPDPNYAQQIEQHRADREARLTREDGWLSLIGLFWLTPGENRFGADPTNRVVLPADAAPAYAGSLYYEDGDVRVVAAPDTSLAIGGAPFTERSLRDDATEGGPDIVQLGRLRFYVIARDGRHAVRLKDPESPARRGFPGIEYFPVDAAYRVRGEFRPYAEPKHLPIATVLGTTDDMQAPGEVEFRLRGRDLKLVALLEPGETEFFFIFKDETSGKESYGAARYLYGALEDGHVWLDFNRAYNPPCAFTPFATCPLPPPGNRLAVRIEAGEKAFH